MTRYHQLDLSKINKSRMSDHASPAHYFDAVVQRVNAKWRRLDHNIVTNNCHHHVADVLNELHYDGRSDWNQVDVAWLVIVRGQRVNLCSLVTQWGCLFALVLYLLYKMT